MATTKKRFFGIFGKVFLYTMLILLIVVVGMFIFFSSQIKSAVSLTQERQTTESFRPLLEQLQGKSEEEITEFARAFHAENRSFEFCFQNADGEILFQTENFEIPQNFETNTETGGKFLMSDERFKFISTSGNSDRTIFLSVGSGMKLYATMPFTSSSVYNEILSEAAWIFAIVFLLSLLSAAFFAWRISRPIRRLAMDTRKMAKLQEVAPPRSRSDEIGQLAEDVHTMYDELKSAIHRAETEMNHVKAMEENQRYFFSAASHELKTPLAASSAILEGLLSDIITPEEYPSYLRECMKLNREQNRLVSEILDIVKLGGNMEQREPEEVKLYDCINSILPPILPIIESKEQQLTLEINNETICKFDTLLFSKAISNVILNATQNSPENAEIRILTNKRGDSIRLSVWNGGVNIPRESMPHLFDPFYREDESRTMGNDPSMVGRRSGLGLTIVKKALDLQGFPFGVKNSKDGVLFWVDIPVTQN